MRLRVLWNFDNCNSNVREEIKQIKIELKIQNLNLVRYFCALPLDKSLNIYIQWWWQCNPRNDDLKQFMNQNDMTELLAEYGISSRDSVKLCLEEPRKKWMMITAAYSLPYHMSFMIELARWPYTH